MAYTVDSLTDGCYPGTAVLINKFNLQSQADLDAVEGALVSAKNALWALNPAAETFDFSHYCALHRYLFEDIYSWAGKVCTVDISKIGTQFCPAAQIPDVAQAVFGRLAKRKLLVGMHKAEFVSALVDLYERTNELRPFREGNGRTQRAFLTQLTQHAGYRLDFTCVYPDDLMIATIQAAGGVDDLLCQLFAEMVKPL